MRPWADLISAYGAGVLPRSLTYTEYVGLRLNISRVRLQRAAEVFTGIGLALSQGSLPEQYFEAIALVPTDAAEMEFATNAQRAVAAARQQHGY